MGGDGKLFSLSQLSQHNTSTDCWLLIDGKVYIHTYIHSSVTIQLIYSLYVRYVCVTLLAYISFNISALIPIMFHLIKLDS